jgi:hypothetical protein
VEVFLGGGRQEHSGVLGVADGGLVVDAEDRGQMQWVWSEGDGFVELAVHA